MGPLGRIGAQAGVQGGIWLGWQRCFGHRGALGSSSMPGRLARGGTGHGTQRILVLPTCMPRVHHPSLPRCCFCPDPSAPLPRPVPACSPFLGLAPGPRRLCLTLDQIDQLAAARSQREGGERLGTADSLPWQYHPELASVSDVQQMTVKLSCGPPAAPAGLPTRASMQVCWRGRGGVGVGVECSSGRVWSGEVEWPGPMSSGGVEGWGCDLGCCQS